MVDNCTMAVATNSFDTWLTKKLQALNTDESVFGSYIKGILEGDESEDEKTEALEDILAGITEDNIGVHVSEILAAWVKWLPVGDLATSVEPAEDVEVRLAKMLESQSLPTTTQRSYTEEEKRIRESILAQYSQMSGGEESDEEGEDDVAGGGGGGSKTSNSGDCGIEKNTNAANIAQQVREKRERAKLESQKKKEKDKEDREKQKQLKEEKKEKRKTVKGERRR